MSSQGFSKQERITSKKDIEMLFQKSQQIFVFPFKVYYNQNIGNEMSQVLITIPKRNFNHASDRNLLKRLFRENYRKYKGILSSKSNRKVQIAFVYVHKEIITYQNMEKSVILALQKISNHSFS